MSTCIPINVDDYMDLVGKMPEDTVQHDTSTRWWPVAVALGLLAEMANGTVQQVTITPNAAIGPSVNEASWPRWPGAQRSTSSPLAKPRSAPAKSVASASWRLATNRGNRITARFRTSFDRPVWCCDGPATGLVKPWKLFTHQRCLGCLAYYKSGTKSSSSKQHTVPLAERSEQS